jgi:hypothetical protein
MKIIGKVFKRVGGSHRWKYMKVQSRTFYGGLGAAAGYSAGKYSYNVRCSDKISELNEVDGSWDFLSYYELKRDYIPV